MSYNFWTGDKVRLRAVELKDAGTFYKWASDYDNESDRFCKEWENTSIFVCRK